MNKSSPSELRRHVGYWLRCLSNLVSNAFAEKLAGRDISVAQWVVLRTLYNQGAVTLNEAAEAVGVDKSSLSRMVERLVQKGLLIRAEGEDRRSVGLTLTSAAMKLVPQLARLADKNDKEFFHTLSGKDRRNFLTAIKRLLDANGWDATRHGRDSME
ncbi:MAG: MarR family winged helix-turn-helix transcriptional regulator [Limisphaerales bacterium]